MSSLPLLWRVFAANASVLVLAFAGLVFEPVTVSVPVAAGELLVLVAGLVGLLIANLVLLRPAFAPLDELAETMRRHDPLAPGRRAEMSGDPDVVPLILVAIVSSILSLGSLTKLRSIGLRSIFWLMLSNALAVALALGLGFVFQPGQGIHRELGGLSTDTIQGQVQSFGQVVVGFFPTNVVQEFSANNIIPIIVIAVTLSVAYLSLAEKEPEKVRPFRDGVEALKLVVFKVVGYVIRLTPYAIVALTAAMVGSSTNLGDDFKSLLGLLALVWAACALHAYVLNGVILEVFADVPMVAFFRKIFPAQLTAFTTQSSIGTLPMTTAQLTRKVGVHSEIAHFTAPLGATIGMPGCAGIWPIMIAIWGINAYGIQYSLSDYAVLAALGVVVSIGVAGVPGAATVSAATVMAAAGLPLEFVAATIPIGVIADMARTATNVTAAAVSATVVARQTGLLDDDIFAGRAEFVDVDEFAQPRVVARPAPVPVPAGAYRDLNTFEHQNQELVGAR